MTSSNEVFRGENIDLLVRTRTSVLCSRSFPLHVEYVIVENGNRASLVLFLA